MLKQTDILRATQEKLKKLYPLPVYLDEVKENFETPCFFLKMLKKVIPHNINANKTLNDCLLVITYLALKGTVQAVDLYDIKDSVAAAFWRGLQVGDRYIHFDDIRNDTDSEEQEIVYIQLPFTYYDTDKGDDEELPRIMKIYQSERIKGTPDFHCVHDFSEETEVEEIV